MAFIPNTTYQVNGTGTVYESFFKAVARAHTIKGTATVTNAAGKVVFTKDDNLETLSLFQYNIPYGKASELSYSQLIPGALNDDTGKMRTWLNNFAYSQAIDNTGALSNSRIRPFYIHKDVYLNSLYLAQEKGAGGYYHVKSLSSIITGVAYKQARVSIDLKDIKANINSTNAYAILGAQSSAYNVEIGLHLTNANGNYIWKVYKKYDKYANKHSEWQWLGEVGSMNCGRTVTLEMVFSGGRAYGKATIDNSDKTFEFDVSFSVDDPHGFYRMISLCPDSEHPNPEKRHDPDTPDLNCGDYYSGVSFRNCQLMQANDVKYKDWENDNQYLTEFAAAFNDQFIEVTPTTEKVSISYKGRDLNNNLILS